MMSFLSGTGALIFGQRFAQYAMVGLLTVAVVIWWRTERYFEREAQRQIGRMEEQQDAQQVAEQRQDLADKARTAARTDNKRLRADPMVRPD